MIFVILEQITAKEIMNIKENWAPYTLTDWILLNYGEMEESGKRRVQGSMSIYLRIFTTEGTEFHGGR